MSGRYERLRAAVVQVLDSEIGDDVVALRRLLADALEDSAGGTPATGYRSSPEVASLGAALAGGTPQQGHGKDSGDASGVVVEEGRDV